MPPAMPSVKKPSPPPPSKTAVTRPSGGAGMRARRVSRSHPSPAAAAGPCRRRAEKDGDGVLTRRRTPRARPRVRAPQSRHAPRRPHVAARREGPRRRVISAPCVSPRVARARARMRHETTGARAEAREKLSTRSAPWVLTKRTTSTTSTTSSRSRATASALFSTRLLSLTDSAVTL